MRIIICNGGYRTGSTLSFNICLMIARMLKGNKVLSIGANHQETCDICKNPSDNWTVIKSHEFTPDQVMKNTKIIHTYRTPFDVAASIRQLMPEKSDDYIVETLIYQRNSLLHHLGREDTLVVHYNMLFNRLKEAIQAICRHLGVATIDKFHINNIQDKLSVEAVDNFCNTIPENGADSYYQWRHKHISQYKGNNGHWKEVLSKELIDKILERGFQA